MRTTGLLQFLLLFFSTPKLKYDPKHRYQRILTIVGRLRLALLLVLLSITVGTVGFMALEAYSLADAFYMSVITLSTVGFGEVRPLSQDGRMFTSFLILFNVGLFAYAISSIVSLFAEGSFTKILHEFRMARSVESLNNHVIICGFGRHSTEVTQELSKQGMPFVVIESEPGKVEYLREETDYLFIDGDATDDDILEEAGIRQARAIITTLPDDADNLFIVLTARQMHPEIRIIARANNQIDEVKMRRAGADQTVVPERIGGFYMATLVDKPDLVEFFRLLSNMGPSNVVFEEVAVRDLKEQYVSSSIAESGLDMLARISLVAIRHQNGQYELNPAKTEVLKPDWHIVLLGNPDQVREFCSQALKHV